MPQNEHATRLKAKRAELQLRSDTERQQLGVAVESIESRIRGVDRGLGKASKLLKRPAVLAGAAAIGLLVGPRRVVRLAGQATLVIAAARRLLRYVRF